MFIYINIKICESIKIAILIECNNDSFMNFDITYDNKKNLWIKDIKTLHYIKIIRIYLNKNIIFPSARFSSF